ncbi:MAG: TetR/AcrR family transcriptional regulator [Lachnospiraceae bacterium]|nr:TetR/AcrR family transcriptional regulator [Lachnospiraceae bacterium]MBQ6995847.1 TetR/AcrR family transcriptional regulator [Lachnospiraceae bacterium]
MGNKSVQKKKYIVEKAREVFCKNGYRKVTMKDIVDACDISRGGLYLYFPDTRSLFEAVLQEEHSDKEILVTVCEDGLTPGEMLLAYLEAQKKVILKQDSLVAATFEYLFEQKDIVKTAREEAVIGLEKLITEGVNAEWMVCENPKVAARNITYVLDGLRISAQVDELTEEEINQEIEYILGTLGLAVE